jgi:hypothetical protein
MMPRSMPQMLPQSPNSQRSPVQAPARSAPTAQAGRAPGFIPVQPLPVPQAPTIRGQSPEEPKPAPVWPPPGVVAAAAAPPAPLAIPAPEQLGLAAMRPVETARLDWAAARTRLDRLGATCFYLEKLDSGWRFTCLLPTAEAGKQRRIDVEAASEAEAVQVALERAEKK